MIGLACSRNAALLGALVSLAGGCDSGVEYVPLSDLSSLAWQDPSADGPRSPDFGPIGCAGNADCQVIGGGSLCCSGACVNPANDPKNCGSCGAACPPMPNGVPACIQGTCFVAGPNAGFADCDGSPVNGYETDLKHDPQNCGECRHVCKAPPLSLPQCRFGTCSVICQPGYADCDGEVANGCETDTTLDVKHCGGCGIGCAPSGHATAACDNGRCGFRCALDYGDCDGDLSNGCETDLRANPSNCGHCGNICPPNIKCVSSRCQ